MRKYGYTARDVFCVDCWLDLVLDGTHKHGVSTDNKLVKTINMKNIGSIA